MSSIDSARGGLVAGEDDQLGDQAGELVVVSGQVGGRVLRVLAQPGEGAGAERREVGLGERVEELLALRRHRDAHRQQRPLAALAGGQLGGGALGRRLGRPRSRGGDPGSPAEPGRR